MLLAEPATLAQEFERSCCDVLDARQPGESDRVTKSGRGITGIVKNPAHLRNQGALFLRHCTVGGHFPLVAMRNPIIELFKIFSWPDTDYRMFSIGQDLDGFKDAIATTLIDKSP
ncbi:MAG: hypothetical protein FWD68_09660 [Alphaproteobacteria bacterium]|nr:hypothetical protein [Alphaproteobacteria bacterium]